MRTGDNGRCRHFPDLTHCGSAISVQHNQWTRVPHEDGGERDACFGREGYYNNNINNVGYRRLHTAGYLSRILQQQHQQCRILATTHIRISMSAAVSMVVVESTDVEMGDVESTAPGVSKKKKKSQRL